ncbi:methionine aminotransferase [Ferruginibacter albus]|uniref:methionine aminotransferase n=1 Tax=Ferruginibacter albus TaxID=2875540 RepID=UPI001CC6B89A|nr:methionine aminotransferase [Ferruginibacter albus]UAY52147.1 aminotransferase class I/II-fold pyridoxal phosphate-dependent enzyme [Ferruginibacter albus]
MNPFIQSKLPTIGTTIFTVMTSLAAEYRSVNLGQGFPDFEMSEQLVELVNTAMKKGNNQYVHMNGLQLLRERISEKIHTLYNTSIDPDKEITITPGGTYAIYTALTTVLQPGDEVIVFEPAYDSYIPNIVINGAIPVLIPLIHPEYKIDWQLVRNKISPKTKMIMLNTPHNPTGSILSKEDIEQLRSIVNDTNIFILSDEVYEHLIFDGKQHESMLRYPDLLERSFICFSFGKTYHCTGWKLGYCIAPASLMKEFRKVHQFNCFSCNSPAQFALAEFLQQKEAYLQVGKLLQQKRDHFQGLMQQTKFKALPSYGSYFQLYDYSNISNEKENDFAVRLTKEYGVTVIPVSAFYQTETNNNVVRFCFAKKNTTLEEAVNKLITI